MRSSSRAGALIDGVVVAQAEGDVTRNPLEDLIWRAQGRPPSDGPIC
jgi:hypothetical protein